MSLTSNGSPELPEPAGPSSPSKEVFIEPLLNEDNNQLTIFPVRHPDIWQAYKTQQACFWVAEDIDFSEDYTDFQKMSKGEQHFIQTVLAFFAASDIIVNLNLAERFINEVKIREAITAYSYQMMMENIHSEVYSLAIDNIIKDRVLRDKLLNAAKEIPCVAGKAEWAKKWIESEAPFSQRLLAFAIVEGIFFSGSFCSIFWLKTRNRMPGLCASNEYIARDEGQHVDFAVLMYSKIVKRLPEETVHEMFLEATAIEETFICESLPCHLIGMNSDSMRQYIHFVADRLLVQLGYSMIWKEKNPFDFMESISLPGKSNFFERRGTQYQNASVLNKSRESAFVITDDI